MNERIHIQNTHIKRFWKDGAVCIRNAIDTGWLKILANGVLKNMAEPGPMATCLSKPLHPGMMFSDQNNWRRIEEYREFVFDSPVAHIVSQLVNARKVTFFHEQILVKEPGGRQKLPWHQDFEQMSVEGNRGCVVWVPLDPIPRVKGLSFVAGSHRWGKYFGHLADPEIAKQFHTEPVPDIDGHPEDYSLLSWDLNPGDCIAIHPLTLHGTRRKDSPFDRHRAVVTRWAGDETRILNTSIEMDFPAGTPLPINLFGGHRDAVSMSLS